jgi:hypothetical protein
MARTRTGVVLRDDVGPFGRAGPAALAVEDQIVLGADEVHVRRGAALDSGQAGLSFSRS